MELRRDGAQADLASVRAYAPAPERRISLASVLVAIYAVALYYCVETSGQAHQQAIDKIRKKNRENFVNKTDPKSVLPDDPLPFEWAPASWAGLLLGVVVTVHVFFHLMCYWRPSFHASALFKPAARVRHGCRVLVSPQEHKGSSGLAEVRRSELTGRCGFEFQRLRYEVLLAPEGHEDEDEELFEDSGEPPRVRRVHCPTDRPLREYARARGLDEDTVDTLTEQYGKNLLTVPIPSFFLCYQEQILSPLVVFQLFLSILWAMDDYLSYTLMQIFMILLFESTTVFQRQRTMKMLNGMTVKPFDVKVYRDGKWVTLSTSDLLPGDLMQLTADRPAPEQTAEPKGLGEVLASAGAAQHASGGPGAAGSGPIAAPDVNAGVCVVPCDCLLLRGEAVVNEASLTGESVPQMKESLILEDEERLLDLEGLDGVHSLASGTSPMSAKAGEVPRPGSLLASLPEPPDGGCVCYVLRTGFSSSQGKLLQMIEFSTDRRAVKADEKEMTKALLILLCFALVAAAYVMKVGLEKGDKTLYELVLKSVIIISSVVPRSLPMTMAVAVNTALMSLLRAGVFCTEPHRVPFGGKLSHCLFDKTGTITTDTLSLEGIVNAKASSDEKATAATGADATFAALGLEPARDASPRAALVLAACHSLVSVEGQGLVGDPIELSALQAAGWAFDAAEATGRPCSAESRKRAVEVAKAEQQKLLAGIEAGTKSYPTPDAAAADKKEKEDLVKAAETAFADAEKEDNKHPVKAAKIIQRYRFLSKLQRSCTVVELTCRDRESASRAGLRNGRYALVKGSPEAVGALLAQGSAPCWYEARYRDLAEHGMRVLALALKELPDVKDAEIPTREQAESELAFVGFIAFSCRTRSDSGLVIAALRESAHSVALVTGDSPLTALHVARQTGICSPIAEALVLQVSDAGEVTWAVATGDKRGTARAFSAEGVRALVQEEGLELMTTESALRAAADKEPLFWENLDHIRVFARMTPQGKADVIRVMQKAGSKVLMCGDGGNDMGALKQADVGLALFSGYGNLNADPASEETAPEEDNLQVAVAPRNQGAEAKLNAQQKDLQKKSRELQKEKQKMLGEKQKELQGKQRIWLEEEMARRQAEGLPTGVMAHAAAMKTVMTRFTQELINERKELDKKYGSAYDKKSKDPLKQLMGESEDGAGVPGAGPMVVRPGDASLAAAFTSRIPSIKSTVDLIRQGRCALLSALQQQQIVMLHCLINAYVLSALSLEGSRSSERQMMASSWLLNTASISFSYARPCDRMHPVRPLRSLFHPAVFVSLAGQAAIHLACLVFATRMARAAMDMESPERAAGLAVGPSLPDVSEFWKKQRLIRRGVIEKEAIDEEDLGVVETVMKQWESPFLPNLMNTVVFLVETSQTVAVLAVNYKGQPWMKGLVENRPLFLSVFVLIGAIAACAWELVPEANSMIHLTPFPGDDFRVRIMVLVIVSIFGTFAWDRICVRIFAPDIYRAMWDSALQTTFQDDILPIFMDCGKIILGFGLFCCGVPGWIGLFLWWKNRKKEE